jgi:DNA primase
MDALMDEQAIKRIEQANPILEIAAEMGIKIRGNLGACFKTQQHTADEAPTLFFNVAKNTFFCKSCRDVGGGVIDFVGQLKGWTRQEAIEWLAHRIEFDRQTRKMYYSRGKKKG